jgi:hypothetical protein
MLPEMREDSEKVDDLPQRLIADLQKSGFAAELAALRVFHHAPFRTVAGQVYFDKFLNSQRQIDLVATVDQASTIAGHIYQAVLSVFAEVKKSEKPWVVLKTSTYENPQNTYLDDSLIDDYNPLTRHNFALRQELAQHAIASRERWFGHGVHEAFKKPDELGRWFKAASSVCRAAWSASPPEPQDNLSTVWIKHPLVILDGRLFSAASDANFEMELTEINRTTVLYQETNASFDRRFLVDLVVLKSLPSYVEELNGRLRIAHAELIRRTSAT